MNLVDNARKTVTTTVTNPKPLYFAAGVGDAAVSALKDAPALLTEASSKAGEVATSVAGRVAGVAETVQSKIALGQLQDDAKELRERISEPDLRAAREKAQTLLLMQVGRALEVAGKAVETYDGYSERGKAVVDRVLAGRVTEVEVVDRAGDARRRVGAGRVGRRDRGRGGAEARRRKPAEAPSPPRHRRGRRARRRSEGRRRAAQGRRPPTTAKKATPRRSANGTAAKKAGDA